MTHVRWVTHKVLHTDKFHEVQDIFSQTITDLNLRGRVEAYGSYRSGFRTGSSDIDVVYIPTEDERRQELSGELTPLMILQLFHVALQRAGFTNIVSVFQASMPLLKAVSSTGADIDFCVGNDLGLRNSRLMKLYADMDHRVTKVGQCIKHWAKHRDITCSSDGHMNSYAYTLLTVFYLMHTDPPILPNLQAMSADIDNAPDLVHDQRWGQADTWDCQFFQEAFLAPRTKNTSKVGELVRGFFQFYAEDFDWRTSAVSIRLARTVKEDTAAGGEQSETTFHHPSKAGLMSTQGSQAWYIEDPFDLRHNLAAWCSKIARKRIMMEMEKMLSKMRDARQPMEVFWAECPEEDSNSVCYLKCRVHLDKVSRDDFVNHFTTSSVLKIFWPRVQGHAGRTEAFLMFANASDRRRTHTLNEQYTRGGWQLRLLLCSTHAIQDARVDSGVVFEEVQCPGNGMDISTDGANAQFEQVRHGLRVAENWDEVQVLLQRALALGVNYEAILKQRTLEGVSSAHAKISSLVPGSLRAKQLQGTGALNCTAMETELWPDELTDPSILVETPSRARPDSNQKEAADRRQEGSGSSSAAGTTSAPRASQQTNDQPQEIRDQAPFQPPFQPPTPPAATAQQSAPTSETEESIAADATMRPSPAAQQTMQATTATVAASPGIQPCTPAAAVAQPAPTSSGMNTASARDAQPAPTAPGNQASAAEASTTQRPFVPMGRQASAPVGAAQLPATAPVLLAATSANMQPVPLVPGMQVSQQAVAAAHFHSTAPDMLGVVAVPLPPGTFMQVPAPATADAQPVPAVPSMHAHTVATAGAAQLSPAVPVAQAVVQPFSDNCTPAAAAVAEDGQAESSVHIDCSACSACAACTAETAGAKTSTGAEGASQENAAQTTQGPAEDVAMQSEEAGVKIAARSAKEQVPDVTLPSQPIQGTVEVAPQLPQHIELVLQMFRMQSDLRWALQEVDNLQKECQRFRDTNNDNHNWLRQTEHNWCEESRRLWLENQAIREENRILKEEANKLNHDVAYLRRDIEHLTANNQIHARDIEHLTASIQELRQIHARGHESARSDSGTDWWPAHNSAPAQGTHGDEEPAGSGSGTAWWPAHNSAPAQGTRGNEEPAGSGSGADWWPAQNSAPAQGTRGNEEPAGSGRTTSWQASRNAAPHQETRGNEQPAGSGRPTNRRASRHNALPEETRGGEQSAGSAQATNWWTSRNSAPAEETGGDEEPAGQWRHNSSWWETETAATSWWDAEEARNPQAANSRWETEEARNPQAAQATTGAWASWVANRDTRPAADANVQWSRW